MNDLQQKQFEPNGSVPEESTAMPKFGFRTSKEISEIVVALVTAQTEFGPAIKDSANPAYRSKYADLSAVIEAVQKPLNKQGIAIMQCPQLDGQMVTVTTRLQHKSGQYFESDLTLPAVQRDRFDAQSVGSAITYARRYSLQAITGLATEDDDGNAASGVASRQTAQQVAQAKIADLEKKLAPQPAEPQPETNGEAPVLFSLQIWPDVFEVYGHSDVMEAHKNLLLLYGKKVVTGRGETRKATVHMDGEKLANFTFEFEKRGGKVKALKPAETNANS